MSDDAGEEILGRIDSMEGLIRFCERDLNTTKKNIVLLCESENFSSQALQLKIDLLKKTEKDIEVYKYARKNLLKIAKMLGLIE